jgi:hypothetical protein
MCALVLKISGNTIRPGARVRAGNAKYAAKVLPSAALIRISSPTFSVVEPHSGWFQSMAASLSTMIAHIQTCPSQVYLLGFRE